MAHIQILNYKLMFKAVVPYEKCNFVITLNLRLEFSSQPDPLPTHQIRRPWPLSSVVVDPDGCLRV